MRFTEIKTTKEPILASRLALGTAQFGTRTSEELSFELLDLYVKQGGNLIDTANVYGRWGDEGISTSEIVIGKWLKARNNRDDLVIVTKGAHHKLGTTKPRVTASDIAFDIEDSLKNLDIDCIDVYFLHRDDENESVAPIMDMLDSYVKAGKIRAIGASNWSNKRVKEANEYAEKTNKAKFTVSQIQWSYTSVDENSLGDSTLINMTDEEYSFYKESKIPVMAFSSQAHGFMIKAIKDGVEHLPDGLQKYICDENLAKIEKTKAVMAETSLSASALGLGYITCNEVDGIAVIGASSLQQLSESLENGDISLSKEIMEKL